MEQAAPTTLEALQDVVARELFKANLLQACIANT
jgi:hypothetical protein